MDFLQGKQHKHYALRAMIIVATAVGSLSTPHLPCGTSPTWSWAR